ncbi:MAG TPA: flagellar biosynthetic protein FliO [Candidatus Baltobacteraceae bacterium]|jgi:flagellar biogenesis protein FliO|nr:flagellar biosynthetic protein FliO [Candidatus Baltobacteraceae bacterium]
MGFIGQYMLALFVVALMLFGLYSVVRALSRGRLVTSTNKRLITVVESTFLAQNTTLHVVKAGERYFMLGGGSGHVATLAEIPAEQVEPWMREQRNLFTAQTQTITGFLKQLRKPQI